MDLKKHQISLRQFLFIYVFIVGSPAIRLFPQYTSKYAKQASWLTIFVAMAVIFGLVWVLHKLVLKIKVGSFLDMTQHILGNGLGTAVNITYLIWITIMAALYVRYYSDRLVGTIFPNVNYAFFAFVLLIVVMLTLRSGLECFARMIEILMPIVAGVFLVLSLLIVPEMKFDNFFPLTYKDILPVMHGSVGIIGVMGYVTVMLIFGDSVHDKSQFKKMGMQTVFFIGFLSLFTIILPIGIFGWQVTSKMNLPYFASIKNISLFGIMERLESGVISIWVATDFAIITVFCLAGLRIIKWLFKTSAETPLINVYLVIVFIMTLYFSNSSYEIMNMSTYVLIPINVVLCIVMPVLLLIVGKIRKKI